MIAYFVLASVLSQTPSAAPAQPDRAAIQLQGFHGIAQLEAWSGSGTFASLKYFGSGGLAFTARPRFGFNVGPVSLAAGLDESFKVDLLSPTGTAFALSDLDASLSAPELLRVPDGSMAVTPAFVVTVPLVSSSLRTGLAFRGRTELRIGPVRFAALTGAGLVFHERVEMTYSRQDFAGNEIFLVCSSGDPDCAPRTLRSREASISSGVAAEWALIESVALGVRASYSNSILQGDRASPFPHLRSSYLSVEQVSGQVYASWHLHPKVFLSVTARDERPWLPLLSGWRSLPFWGHPENSNSVYSVSVAAVSDEVLSPFWLMP